MSLTTISEFTVGFAHLVWSLSRPSEEPDTQHRALHRCMSELGSVPRSVVLRDVTQELAAAFQVGAVNEETTWLAELARRMSEHSVRQLVFEAGAMPREVLAVARLLCEEAVPGDEGNSFDSRFVALSLPNVSAELGAIGFVRRATPPRASVLATNAATTDSAIAGHAEKLSPAVSLRSPAGGSATRDATPDAAQDVQNEGREMLIQAVAGQAERDAIETSLRELMQARPQGADELVSKIIRLLEMGVTARNWDQVAKGLDALVTWSRGPVDESLRRSVQLAFRRLARPMVLSELAKLLPQRRDLREPLARILEAAGEAGADAVIGELVNSQTASERKAYRAVLAKCKAAIPTLIHLLDDERWYVVRNAVELLGDLGEPGVERHIAKALSHTDPRVRRAAVSSVTKLGARSAVPALLGVLADPIPEVRLQAVLGLAAAKDERAVPWLVEAMSRESDSTVRIAMVRALGKLPSEEGVLALIAEAQPGGPLRRKPIERRIAAVEALAQAGTERARAALSELAGDRDPAIRAAVARFLGH